MWSLLFLKIRPDRNGFSRLEKNPGKSIDSFYYIHLYVSDTDRYPIESDRVIHFSKRSIRLSTRWLVYICIASNDLERRNVARVPESI